MIPSDWVTQRRDALMSCTVVRIQLPRKTRLNAGWWAGYDPDRVSHANPYGYINRYNIRNKFTCSDVKAQVQLMSRRILNCSAPVNLMHVFLAESALWKFSKTTLHLATFINAGNTVTRPAICCNHTSGSTKPENCTITLNRTMYPICSQPILA